jgi:hypothetical protein
MMWSRVFALRMSRTADQMPSYLLRELSRRYQGLVSTLQYVLLPAYGHSRAELDPLECKLEKYRETVMFSILTLVS